MLNGPIMIPLLESLLNYHSPLLLLLLQLLLSKSMHSSPLVNLNDLKCRHIVKPLLKSNTPLLVLPPYFFKLLIFELFESLSSLHFDRLQYFDTPRFFTLFERPVGSHCFPLGKFGIILILLDSQSDFLTLQPK